MDENKSESSPSDQRVGFIPPRLEYQRPNTYVMPDRGPLFAGWKVLVGLMVGTMISVLIWIPGFDWINARFGLGAICIVGAVKFLSGFVMLFLGPKYRGFGLGLIISLPLGGLIFFGTCASRFRV